MAIGKNPNHKRTRKKFAPSERSLKVIEGNPQFKTRLARMNAIPIDRSYDIPYLAGYSKDGRKVYFDRHFDFKYNGRDISKYIRLHEVVEKAIIDIFNYKYQDAHKYATFFERRAVEDAGINWEDYCKRIDPFIKIVHREHLKKVPKDLDLTPYQDEHEKKLLNIMIRDMKEEVLTETKISLEYHDKLNPLLWDGTKLRPEVKKKLIEFGYAWASFAKIPRDMIQDIIMLGGNANYNYTSKSDIDVHIMIDRNAFAKGASREIIDEYLQDKKLLWTLTHKIAILGISLEPYAQHSEDGFPSNQGVYSLSRGEWIQFPNRGEYDFKNDKALKQKVMFYKKSIDDIIKNKMGSDIVREFKRKIREMRGSAIARGGEFSLENLVFKELRNRGYLDKMNRYEQSLKDQSLSLK
jgi:hypothetical protein